MARYVKDVIDIDKLIAEGKTKIFLIAGVCSGKSTWVKEVLTQKGSVLFVTSRKAKAESDIKNSTFKDIIDWYTDNNQTLVTNAGLAHRIENYAVNSTKDVDVFLDHFDYIVIDEVHSIASDSLFAKSCPAVLAFIEYVVAKQKPIICMTGTPEPIREYFLKNGWYFINLLETCNYVHPTNVTMINNHNTIGQIKTMCVNNKILYFANRTDSIKRLCKQLIENGIAKPSEIAVSVSKNRETEIFSAIQKELDNDEYYEEIEISSKLTYESIIDKKCLPHECKILLSTSTLKEGIDIDNENVVMFCENHVLSNLIQFFGRARKGKTKVYVVADAADHSIKQDSMMYEYATRKEVIAANQYYKSHLSNVLLCTEEHRRFIQHICKNPYIYFDYLNNEFRVFHLKYAEETRLKRNFQWKDDLLSHCMHYGINAFCFKNETFMQNTLHQLAEKKDKLYGEKNINIIRNVLYSGYGIDKKQPSGINKELEKQNVNIRIDHGRGSKGESRNMTYWQVMFLDDYLKK